VIGMLAIGAGARQESLRFIEELGVRNLLVQSPRLGQPAGIPAARKTSPGTTARDVRIVQANLEGLERLSPEDVAPQQGASQAGARRPGALWGAARLPPIHGMKVLEGRFFDEQACGDISRKQTRD